MNRLLSLFLSIILVLTMPVISVSASDALSVVIDNPANRSVVENTEIEVELTTTGSVSQTVLELDGVKIDGTTLTESMLTIGEHTLTAYVIGEDGSVESTSNTFSVVKNINSKMIECDFTDIDSGEENFTKSVVQLGAGVTCTPQISKTWKGVPSVVDGPDGEGDKAINFTSASSFSSSRPFYRFLSQNGNITTTAIIDFDIMVNSGTNVLFSYVVPDTVVSNGTGYLKSNTDYLFDKTGKILGTSETYSANKWYNVKLIVDVQNGLADLFVSHYDDESEEDVEVQILDNEAITPTGGTLSDIRINYHGNNNCGFSIDNVLMYEEATFTGIEKIGFVYGEEETTDTYPDSSKLTAVKVYMNEAVTATDFTDAVELTDKNGATVALTDVSYNSDDNAILITPSELLSVNSEYKVLTHLSVNYPGTLTENDKAMMSFKTAADSYALTDVELKVGTTKLLTAAQLKGKKLTADVHFSNSEAQQTLSVVLAVRSKNKLVGLDITDVTIPEDTSDYVVSLTTPTLSDVEDDVTIQIMLLESMTNRKTVFATHEAKF